MVQATGVRKSFAGNEVLRGVDLSVPRGSVTCVIGPSGSGKSTFLRCVNHLERPDSGQILVDGSPIGYERHGRGLRELRRRDLARQRRRIGMVFQRFHLFPHLTALGNITEGPVGAGRSRAEATDEAMALLDRVGLTDRRDAYPAQLSGGQQQRVAIARALAMRPKLMLFDEPTSALDPELVGEVLDVMRGLAADGMTMLVVTHELAFAREVADEVVFLDDGRVLESGPPDRILTAPDHPRTRDFVARVL
ncbi:amino acid ABC transporter ATP-binding protein [Streptomyces sp. NBC_01314]|uniref:amino acid ABC transporter ATP-binding protein n=1 Tax=Streptomyces sp. NBC_01314 TaxID=2903821 RepID=UPI00308B8E07|nr:amino acid ABC transporter ATP-binding protein [Streptomyces sp. NBC_01314]